ncbi:MAG: hypothetical protein D6806_05885 [Deltaproteobacteria bacterium]|nr:MAG: hypothetical protein D6806_05885 [Deltaproteobacteria bacterium]
MRKSDPSAQVAALLRLLELLVGLLPYRLARAFSWLLSGIWYHLLPVRKKVSLDNLARAFPEMDVARRRRLARRCFGQLALCGVEYLRLWRLDVRVAAEILEVAGYEHLERAIAAGKGVVVVTGHLANFDLAACCMALRGLEFHVITRRAGVGAVDRFWMRRRERFGIGFVSQRNSAMVIHRTLRKGGIVVFMIDQHMPLHHGIVVDFLGMPASTTPAPALFSYHTGAPIVPVCTERLEGQKQRLTVFEPIEPDRTAPREREVEKITRHLNLWLEQRIRQNPEQWLWVHRRWKVPAGAVGES